MPKNGANISLSSFDDIFSTDESRNVEKIQQISISELHHFKDHPFKVLDDEPCSGRWRAWHSLEYWLL